ncbi:hypothetical protein [Bordetella sp. N]|uniref:hypothetical protein n=1 Tax=Bordetella sp. N TaxID=1746199 RepID=UPI0018D2306F|nr:hypothetical protein [Bordetella sp. N]
MEISELSWSAFAKLLFPALVGPCNTIAVDVMCSSLHGSSSRETALSLCMVPTQSGRSSMLLQGIQADDGLKKQMDLPASALLCSRLSKYWLSGIDGLYLSRKAPREQTSLLHCFLGGPESYADLAITKRFEAGWE